MSFGDWLLDELNRRGMNQSDLARAISRSTATVSRWVSGQDAPNDTNLRAIARALGVSEDEIGRAAGVNLIAARPAPRSAEDILRELEANQPVAVPVIQNVVASMGAGFPVEEYLYLPPAYRRGRKTNIVAVIADGDCMAPEIREGDYVIFDKDAKWEVGNIVVAAVGGEVMVKRLHKHNGRIVLRADATGETVTLGEDDQIFGRVLQITRPLF